jgi:hypothetical protein
MPEGVISADMASHGRRLARRAWIDVAYLVEDEVLAREPGSYQGTDTIGADIMHSLSGKSPWPAQAELPRLPVVATVMS